MSRKPYELAPATRAFTVCVYTLIGALGGFIVPCAVFGVSAWCAAGVPFGAWLAWKYALWAAK